MKMAILQCDVIPEPFQSKYGDYPDLYQRLFPDFACTSFRTYANEFPQDINEYEVYLISGSRASVYEDLPWIKNLMQWVVSFQTSSKKLIGICFGHQIIAEALGGKVRKSADGWQVGIQKFTLNKSENRLINGEGEILVPMLCQDQVLYLPETATVLATNPTCAYAMLQYGPNILTVQGHPEFSCNYLEDVILSREKLIGPEKAKNGLYSLQKGYEPEVLQEIFNEFIYNFE